MYLLSKKQLQDLWIQAWIKFDSYKEESNGSKYSFRDSSFQQYLEEELSKNILSEEELKMLNKPKFIVYSDAVSIEESPKEQPINKDEEVKDESGEPVISEAKEN